MLLLLLLFLTDRRVGDSIFINKINDYISNYRTLMLLLVLSAQRRRIVVENVGGGGGGGGSVE